MYTRSSGFGVFGRCEDVCSAVPQMSQNEEHINCAPTKVLIFATLCRSVGLFRQGSAKIVALNPEEPYRSVRYLQKCADFL